MDRHGLKFVGLGTKWLKRRRHRNVDVTLPGKASHCTAGFPQHTDDENLISKCFLAMHKPLMSWQQWVGH